MPSRLACEAGMETQHDKVSKITSRVMNDWERVMVGSEKRSDEQNTLENMCRGYQGDFNCLFVAFFYLFAKI